LTGFALPFKILSWLSVAGLLVGWSTLTAGYLGVLERELGPLYGFGFGGAILFGMLAFSPLGVLRCSLSVSTLLVTLYFAAGGASC
jgi:hypothetical protein